MRSLRSLPFVLRHAAFTGLVAGLAVTTACGSSASKAPSADTWAVVDGRTISRDEVEKAYGTVAQPATAPSEEEILTLKLRVLDELIGQDLMVARAQALKVEATDAEVDKSVTERKGTMTDEAFLLQLTGRGLTLDDFKRGVRREMTVQKLVDHEVTAKINITDDDIAAFYNANKAQFDVKEPQIHMAQIVVTPVADQVRNRTGNDAQDPAAARRKVDSLIDQIKAGADFSTLAADYSEDPQTASQGGDLGFVPETQIAQAPAAIRNVVMNTQIGNVSTVPMNGGYTLVKVLAREKAGQRQLTDAAVRESITNLLKDRKQQLLHSAFVTELRDSAKVQNYLAKMVIDQQGKAGAAAAAAPKK